MEINLREENIQKYMQEMIKESPYSKFKMEIPLEYIMEIRDFAFRQVQRDEIDEYNSKQTDWRAYISLYPKL